MNISEQLYRDIFVKTGGFMMNWPFGTSMRIGDFFALRPGHIGVVGNIYEEYFQLDIKDSFATDIYKFQAPVLEPYIEKGGKWEVYKPNDDLWRMKKGCMTNYSSDQFIKSHKRKILAPEINTYKTTLDFPGDYFFIANDVKYFRMPHFREIHKELIRRLTTEFYNFNKIYLVTEVAQVDNFSLAISKHPNAEIVLSREDYFNGNILDILAAQEAYNVERAQGMEQLLLAKPGGSIAFRAKKMTLSVKAKDTLIQEIYKSADKAIAKYANELIDNQLFHLFPKIEINPANANEFFNWQDLALEDIEVFLGAHAN